MALLQPHKKNENELEKIDGSVERVTFHSEESGFAVLRVKVKGHRELVTVVGRVPNIVPGEWIVAEGGWIVDKQHGRQFKAESLKSMPPESLAGIEKFLGSGMVKGIGPVYAAKLVAEFGKDIFDVIENKSALLERVPGIGRMRRVLIKEGWNETVTIRAIMSFLLSNGVSTARAFRIFKQYGNSAIQKVKKDPYCLSRDIRGIGFKSADQIAMNMGIEKESDLRARAGVEHVLLEVTKEGHCAFPREQLIEKTVDILNIPEEIVAAAIDYGLKLGRLVQDEDNNSGLLLIFLRRLYLAEVELTKDLKALAAGKHPCPSIDIKKAIAWCEDKIGIELAPAQCEALNMAVTEKVVVMTGGPGVGKTTLINAIIKVLSVKKMKVVLAAPTGRAAKRLAEASGCKATTIHRLLAFDVRTGGFKHNKENPLAGDVFIIDESSMIDIQLAQQLVCAIPRSASLLLVGDVNQLPSVGPGSVLRDIIESDIFSVERLTHVFRQAAQSHIITNAHKINHGQMPIPGAPGSNSDFYFVEVEDSEKGAETVVKMVHHNIPKKFGFNAVRDIQVLTPMHRGAMGAQNLNARLQEVLNPRGDTIERFGYKYRVGDKVMQIENDYDKDVFNGDMGLVKDIKMDDHEIVVVFDGRSVTYSFNEIDELVPSFAITIHKSQGSEYPCVVIPVHTQHYIMLQRNLIYTAITRGRALVVLIGTWKALGIAIKRMNAHQRITTLATKLRRLDA
jgi:exodeoxyribonuclease V alpha subunit